MKKLTLLTAILFAFLLISCNSKDDDPKKPFKFDRNAKVNLSPDMSGWNTVGQGQRVPEAEGHLTPLQIVEQTIMLRLENKSLFADRVASRRFSDEQRDFNPKNPKLKMFASDIIDQEGDIIFIVPDFIESKNVTLVRRDSRYAPLDTIAYIPNETLRTAEKAIKEAFAKKDYDTVYQLFEDAYTFLPVTAEELREIRK